MARWLSVLIFGLSGCAVPSLDESLIVASATPITLLAPEDGGSLLSISDVVFQWESAGDDAWTVALAHEPLSGDSNTQEILNASAIFWLWNPAVTSMGSPLQQQNQRASLPISAGRVMIFDTNDGALVPDPSNPVLSLQSGISYYWAVWQLSERGRIVAASPSWQLQIQ